MTGLVEPAVGKVLSSNRKVTAVAGSTCLARSLLTLPDWVERDWTSTLAAVVSVMAYTPRLVAA